MNRSDHHRGFETEAALINMFKEQSEVAQWKDFKERHPALFADAFQRKPCRRNLRYVRQTTSSLEEGFFVEGDVYRSTHFNGATYSIEGHPDRLFGSNHFELLIDMTFGGKNEKK